MEEAEGRAVTINPDGTVVVEKDRRDAEAARLTAERDALQEKLDDIYERATTAQRAALGLDEGE